MRVRPQPTRAVARYCSWSRHALRRRHKKFRKIDIFLDEAVSPGVLHFLKSLFRLGRFPGDERGQSFMQTYPIVKRLAGFRGDCDAGEGRAGDVMFSGEQLAARLIVLPLQLRRWDRRRGSGRTTNFLARSLRKNQTAKRTEENDPNNGEPEHSTFSSRGFRIFFSRKLAFGPLELGDEFVVG